MIAASRTNWLGVVDKGHPLATGLVAFFAGDVNTCLVRDLAGNVGGATYVGGPLPIQGYNGMPAILYNGASTRLEFGKPRILNFGSGNFTFAAWFKTFAGGGGAIVANDNDGTPFRMLDSRGGSVQWGFRDTIGNIVNIAATSTVNDGTKWHFATGVRDGLTGLVYVNGRLENSATASVMGSTDNNATWMLGKRDGSGFQYGGSIGPVLIYNRALKASEVAALYNLDLRLLLYPTRRRRAKMAAASGGASYFRGTLLGVG